MAKKQLTMEDINAITLDFYFRSPDAILAGLYGACDDPAMIAWIFEECKNRNINVVEILEKDIRDHKRRWGVRAR